MYSPTIMNTTPDTDFSLRKRQSLPEELAEVIIRRIEAGEFKPGDVLPSEQALADTFKVSRTVVREALARLKYEGLVQSKRGSGPIVCNNGAQKNFSINVEGLSRDELLRFMEFRVIMEGESAALAALRRSEEQITLLSAYLDQMQQAIENNNSGTEPDYLFHCLIADSGRNEYLGEFAKFLSAKIWLGVYRARWLSNQVRDQAQAVLEEHRAIFLAIKAEDPQGARAAAQRHLLNSAARQGLVMDTRSLSANGALSAP